MKRFLEKCKQVFAAVSFAEQGEWDDALKIADGKIDFKAADGKKIQPSQRSKKRRVDNRPQLRV